MRPLNGSLTSNVIGVTEAVRSFLQDGVRWRGRVVMSTIQELREAEKKVKEVLEALKNCGAHYPDELTLELQKSTDEYARAVRELK